MGTKIFSGNIQRTKVWCPQNWKILEKLSRSSKGPGAKSGGVPQSRRAQSAVRQEFTKKECPWDQESCKRLVSMVLCGAKKGKALIAIEALVVVAEKVCCQERKGLCRQERKGLGSQKRKGFGRKERKGLGC